MLLNKLEDGQGVVAPQQVQPTVAENGSDEQADNVVSTGALSDVVMEPEQALISQ